MGLLVGDVLLGVFDTPLLGVFDMTIIMGILDMILLGIFDITLLVVVPTTEEVPTQIQRHSVMNL